MVHIGDSGLPIPDVPIRWKITTGRLTVRRGAAYSPTMATLTIQLPPQRTQTEFNLRRWTELLADPDLARFEGRVETDRYGHVLMSPPPASQHGRLQARIAISLNRCMDDGEVLTECPISTADGVRAADVAWASADRLRELGDQACFRRAPEICVEVFSPGNTEAELREKMALYFDAGAREVWLCSESGTMRFFCAGEPEPIPASRLCPEFPPQVELRPA
jgi:Uma2 family endonuclease